VTSPRSGAGLGARREHGVEALGRLGVAVRVDDKVEVLEPAEAQRRAGRALAEAVVKVARALEEGQEHLLVAEPLHVPVRVVVHVLQRLDELVVEPGAKRGDRGADEVAREQLGRRRRRGGGGGGSGGRAHGAGRGQRAARRDHRLNLGVALGLVEERGDPGAALVPEVERHKRQQARRRVEPRRQHVHADGKGLRLALDHLEQGLPLREHRLQLGAALAAQRNQLVNLLLHGLLGPLNLLGLAGAGAAGPGARGAVLLVGLLQHGVLALGVDPRPQRRLELAELGHQRLHRLALGARHGRLVLLARRGEHAVLEKDHPGGPRRRHVAARKGLDALGVQLEQLREELSLQPRPVDALPGHARQVNVGALPDTRGAVIIIVIAAGTRHSVVVLVWEKFSLDFDFDKSESSSSESSSESCVVE
jgi:hypothetical protein